MYKHRKKFVENLLRHMIYKTTQTLCLLQDSKFALKQKNLPLWIEEPMRQNIEELIEELSISLDPVLEIMKQEYKSRPDREILVQDLENKLSARKNGPLRYEPCQCSACQENRL